MSAPDLESRVRKLEKALSAFSQELHLALRYIQPDAASSLTKSRVILEKLLIRVYSVELGQEPRKPLLGEMLADNQFTRKIERRILSRMNTIRDMGNLGPHGERVEPNDAARVLDDLCEVLDWYLRRYAEKTPTSSGKSSSDDAATVAEHAHVQGSGMPLLRPVPGKPFRNSLGNVLLPVPEAFLPQGPPSALYVSTTSVSNADYLEFVQAGGPEPRGSPTHPSRRSWQGKHCPESLLDHPVLYVPHADACLFCDWQTDKERGEGRIDSDQRYRLPTFEQWKAWARCDKLPKDAVTDREWRLSEQQPTIPVSWGEPSTIGLYHLFGNVFQWCLNESEKDGVPQKLAIGGGWASTRTWLEQEIRQGTFGAIWRRRGLPMKDGGFRLCLYRTVPAPGEV